MAVKKCSIEGCEGVVGLHGAKGLCFKHYQRLLSGRNPAVPTRHDIRPIRIEGTVAYVPLTQGKTTIIDAADVPLIEGRNWYARESSCVPGTFYAHSRAGQMHRIIMSAVPGQIVDHKNHDTLDNRRCNLRFATAQSSSANRRNNLSSRSRFKGVYQFKGKWRASIRVNREAIYLGQFESETDAAQAYDAAARVTFKDFACVNFPEGSANQSALRH